MKLAEALRIVQSNAAAAGEKFEVYLACGIFPLHLSTFLAAHLSQRRPERAIEIRTGLYGDLPGNLVQLRESSAHAGAVVVEWSDLDPRLGLRRLGGWGPGALPDIQATVQRNADQLLQLLAAAAPSTPLALCLPTIPLPPISYQPGEQLGPDNLLLEKALFDFTASAAEIPQLKIVSRQRLDTISAIAERLDVKSDLSTGFPYRTPHADKVAELFAGLIQPRPPKKGLITDLDDTLWRGILGEEGVQGISWDLDQRSHIHALYQQLLAALAESGVLLGVASKNDPALTMAALDREDLLLAKESFFPVEANWNSKSQSVGRILEAWNINADAVVFVDDSALELAEVNAAHPALECLRFPIDDEQAAYDLLEKVRDLFGKQQIMEEDSIRVASLRSGGEFQTRVANDSAQQLATFLGQVDAELTLGPVAVGDARAFELVNKTNQFNLNGIRRDEVELQAALNRPEAMSLVVSYKDKYGPLGKIAVLLGEVDGSVLKVDTWVMSCRAFSRHIEYQCLDYLFRSFAVAAIELDFRTTPRNGPLQDFLGKLVRRELTSPITIQREDFVSSKPRLSHKINEVSYA
jgi:FkbH-like protein